MPRIYKGERKHVGLRIPKKLYVKICQLSSKESRCVMDTIMYYFQRGIEKERAKKTNETL